MRLTSEMILQSRDTIGDVPPELIGASTALAGSKLYLFGGSLASAPDPKPLSELYALDLELWKWEAIIPATGDPVPTARYFHTVDIWKNHLVICGGLGAQGSSEQLQVLNDVQLYNLSTRRWLRSPRVPAVSRLGPVPRARHAHLSCVSSNQLFIIGGKDFFGEILDDVCVYDLAKKEWIHRQYSPIPRLEMTHSFAANSQWHVRTPPPDPPPSGKPDNLVRPTPLSYSDRATNKSPCDIYLYNADHLQRKLEILSPSPDGAVRMRTAPPGAIAQLPFLRFPSGTILGKTLILAGNSLPENTEHGFLIWTLDLETNRWTRIETGELLNNGSWAKGYLWHEQSKFFVFGKHGGSFVDAADRLVLGWDMVAVVDLEAALGIYQPPVLASDAAGQRQGLAALAEGKRTDFDFLCEDGRRIPCSRKIIVERWSWFRDQHARLRGADDSAKHQKRAEITIMQTGATLAQSYPVTMALLQYFYSLALGTPLQRAPAVLSYLMLISTEFEIPHLRALVRHAMHVALNETTAEGVYEIAASCGCRSLQIRAFRIHTESKDKKRSQANSTMPQKTGRARSNSEGTRLGTRSGRSAGVNAAGFPSSAFTRPLYLTNNAAANIETTAPPQVPRQIPPLPSSIVITRSSDPLPKPRRGREFSPPNKSQHELSADVLTGNRPTEKTIEPSTDAISLQKKRSQSVGSRIPRPVSRLAREAHPLDSEIKASATTTTTVPVPAIPSATTMTTATVPEPAIPITSTDNTTTSSWKGSRVFARCLLTHNARKVEGPKPQNRERKAQTTVVAATAKGAENTQNKLRK